MCRMCLVEVDSGRGPQLQPSCMVTVAPGMMVDTESPIAQAAQEGIIELLLANHPLDCPVCDKGGECPLQDQSFSHGPGESRYVEEKRHYEKPIPISDLVLPRSRALHPVRPLHPLRRRGRRRRADPLHQPRQPHAGQHVPRRAVRQLLQRQHRADLPGRRADRQAVPVQGPPVGPRADREHVHHVLGRVPHRRAVEPRRAGPLPGRRQRSGQLGLAVRSGPLRLRGGQQRSSASSAPLVRVDGELAADVVERRAGRAAAADHRGREGRRRAERIAVLGGARGTNEDAYAWARLAHDVIGTPNVYPQLGDGLPVGVLGFDPGHDRRGRQRATRSSCSRPTSRKSCRCCTCACATRRQKRRSRDHRVRAEAQRADEVAWRTHRATSRAHHGRRGGSRCARSPTSPRSSPRARS